MPLKPALPYFILALLLLPLSLLFIYLSAYRIYLALAISLTYFIWGILVHQEDKTLHSHIILEYFGFSLLGFILLLFISLRA